MQTAHSASFRDPSGRIIKHDGEIYRTVNNSYKEQFDYFLKSGLYEALTKEKLILRFEEAKPELFDKAAEVYKVIKPEQLPYISYPYEWCFSELKDAALVTLKIQKISLDFGMILKDATAYNIQFFNGLTVHIDTLSFEKYNEGEGWVAYRQFCEHFLAPLLLMSYVDISLNQLLAGNIDGIPLALAAKLLPFKAKLRPSVFSHISLQALGMEKLATTSYKKSSNISKNGLYGLNDNLTSLISSLKPKIENSKWSSYYNKTSLYSSEEQNVKMKIIGDIIGELKPDTVLDLGCNEGVYSKIAAKHSKNVVSVDYDRIVIEALYCKAKAEGINNILPLYLDYTNPAPGIGFENKERDSFLARADFDLCIALAFMHHMVSDNNIPFLMLAKSLSCICKKLIIEFVPLEDANAQTLIKGRNIDYSFYTKENFEREFGKVFLIDKTVNILNSGRVIYYCSGKK